MLTEAEFNRHIVAVQPGLMAFAVSLTRDTTKAEDLVQDTLFRAIRSKDKFEAGTNFDAWVFTICKNHFFSQRRSAYESKRTDDAEGAILGNVAADVVDAGDQLEQSNVALALKTLPAAQREALEAIARGESYEAAAERLKVSDGTIKSRVNRARETLIEFSGTTQTTKRGTTLVHIGGKSGLRPIDTSVFRNPPKPKTEVGPQPEVAWIPIKDLFIDESYQRLITEQGITSVYRMVAEFDWKKFGAVVLAKVGDKYAIIDGQHRTYAAALRGFESIPATIVEATKEEQAAAFAAINTKVVKVNDLAVHRAAVAAGDKTALAIDHTCAQAGVSICRYKCPENKLKPGETLALGTIRNCIRRYGEATVVMALRLIQHRHSRDVSMLRAPLIQALAAVVSKLDQERPAALLSRVESINLQRELLSAKVRAAEKSVSVWYELYDSLLPQLAGEQEDAA